jgi:hypothetical protein
MQTIYGWNQQRERIFRFARTKGMSKLRKYRPSQAHHPEAEVKLYTMFVWRRMVQRLRTSRKWLKLNMLDILRSEGVATEFVAADGWVANFCSRWRITHQRKSNEKKLSLAERLPEIRKFQLWLIYGLQCSAPQRCPKYGRFDPRRMFHMDQVPLPFSSSAKTTLNMKGSACHIQEAGGSGATKRFCTIQMWICADPWGGLWHKPDLIFRGQGKNLGEEERLHYAAIPNLTIRFQPKAWADEKIMMASMLDFREATIDLGEVLLGMDNHGSQATPLCREFMTLMGIQPAYTPPDCTDVVSPVDHHVGQTLKLKIAKRYDKVAATWDQLDGAPSDSHKRMLVATWTSEAWDELSRDNKHAVHSAFVKTGFLVAKDGSENHLIDISDGGKAYDF